MLMTTLERNSNREYLLDTSTVLMEVVRPSDVRLSDLTSSAPGQADFRWNIDEEVDKVARQLLRLPTSASIYQEWVPFLGERTGTVVELPKDKHNAVVTISNDADDTLLNDEMLPRVSYGREEISVEVEYVKSRFHWTDRSETATLTEVD